MKVNWKYIEKQARRLVQSQGVSKLHLFLEFFKILFPIQLKQKELIWLARLPFPMSPSTLRVAHLSVQPPEKPGYSSLSLLWNPEASPCAQPWSSRGWLPPWGWGSRPMSTASIFINVWEEIVLMVKKGGGVKIGRFSGVSCVPPTLSAYNLVSVPYPNAFDCNINQGFWNSWYHLVSL